MTRSALPASLDALKLRAQLAAATAQDGWASPASRSAGLAHVKAALERFREQAFARLSGDGGGAAAG